MAANKNKTRQADVRGELAPAGGEGGAGTATCLSHHLNAAAPHSLSQHLNRAIDTTPQLPPPRITPRLKAADCRPSLAPQPN